MSVQPSFVNMMLERLRGGDQQAAGQLVGLAAARLERLGRSMLRSSPRVHRWEDTGDLVQEAMLRLWKALAEVVPADEVGFHRFAACHLRRTLLDMARKHGGPEGLGAGHASVDGTPPDAAAPTDNLEAWAEFHAAAEELDIDQKTVFDLLWYQGFTQPEAAELLGVTDRTIRQRWRDARIALGRRLRGGLPEAS